MTVKGRMKGILEKQAAADRARKAEEARLAAVEKDAAALRSRVEQKWVELSAVLTETIMSANNAMTGGRKLHVAHEIMPEGSPRIGEVTFSFENKPSNLVHRKCVISVSVDGTIFVSMSGEGTSPKKDYRLDVSTAAKEQIEGIVYDFLELNV